MAEDSLKSDRVFQHTKKEVNEEILKDIEVAVTYYSVYPEKIESRLQELNKEWDIERALEANASILALFGLTLGIFGKRVWLLLPLIVTSFLLQHAIQGWCPPIEILRRIGLRTKEEILRERSALKALRGDYDSILQIRKEPANGKTRAVLQSLAG